MRKNSTFKSLRKLLAEKSLLFYLLMVHRGIDDLLDDGEIHRYETRDRPQAIETRKKILIVGMSESPHLHSWLEGLAKSGLVNDVWLFPSDYPYRKIQNSFINVREFPYHFIGKPSLIVFRVLDILTNRLWRSYFLFREIKRVKPTHLHFHETQNGAYMYNPIARHPKNCFKGKIILSTWGSDLIVYGKTQSHLARIRKVLSWVDILTSERIEDLDISISNGYRNRFFAPIYISIGNRDAFLKLKKTSSRTLVLIKGYQHDFGRALNALASIELLASKIDLSKFRFRVYSASESVKLKVELMKSQLLIDIDILPHMSKVELQEYFREARVYLGLSISDGLSTSMVEAMSNGAFPIQSENSSAPQFLKNWISGGVVNPWRIDEIMDLLSAALFDDELVDRASTINLNTLKNKFQWDVGLKKLAALYE